MITKRFTRRFFYKMMKNIGMISIAPLCIAALFGLAWALEHFWEIPGEIVFAVACFIAVIVITAQQTRDELDREDQQMIRDIRDSK